ncbi:MAG TPA: Hsp20/alpha crystallin family protein [Pyrinomonadaceae bacterium]|nr:Hsp20/alpha crystallin family protein [Pyrinomonadaceae bacterium]
MRPIVLERNEVERLRERVGRLLAVLSEVMGEAQDRATPGAWMPPADVCETAREVVVRVELPGVTAGDVEVVLTGNALRVTGAKKSRAPRGRVTHLCSERAYGKFCRTVPLRRPVRTRGAHATLKDGLLTVTLPKLDERRGAEFRIEVRDVAGDK